MRIDIVSDIVCPWCFVGKRRLEKVLQMRPAMRPEMKWRPFTLNPDVPIEGRPFAEHYARKFGGEEEAQRVLATIRQGGLDEGIAFRFDLIKTVPHTLKAQQLIRLAGEHGVQDAVGESLFRAYFLEGLDIGSTEVLQQIAAAAGVDHPDLETEFTEGLSKKVVERDIAVAVGMGVTVVPTFLLNQKYAITGVREPFELLQILDRVYNEELASRANPTASAPQASSLS